MQYEATIFALIVVVLVAGIPAAFYFGRSRPPREPVVTDKSRGRQIPRKIALITILGSCIALLLAFYDTAHSCWYLWHAQRSPGTVVEIHEREENDQEKWYAPVVAYSDRSGRDHRITASVYADPPTHQVGDVVNVLYDPMNPDDAILEFWQRPIAVGVTGAFLGVVGLLTLNWPQIVARYQRRKNDGETK